MTHFCAYSISDLRQFGFNKISEAEKNFRKKQFS